MVLYRGDLRTQRFSLFCRMAAVAIDALVHGVALQSVVICISFHVGDIRLMACDWCDEY